MDKKIYIDGVDVSECNFYRDKEHTKSMCKKSQKCYYKQLQLAKVENKELERKYADVLKLAKDNADSNEYCLQELEQENEELKGKYNGLNANYNSLKFENERLKEESKEKAVITRAYNDLVIEIISNIPYVGEIRPDNITPLDVLRNIKKEQKAYKQSLQEIREIAKEQLQDVSDRCINTTPMYIVHKHIIAKINEVIGAE